MGRVGLAEIVTVDVRAGADEIAALFEPEVVEDWSDEMVGAAGLALVLRRRADAAPGMVRLPLLVLEEGRVLGDVLRVALEWFDGLGGEVEADLGPDAAAVARSLRTAVAEAVATAERTATVNDDAGVAD